MIVANRTPPSAPASLRFRLVLHFESIRAFDFHQCASQLPASVSHARPFCFQHFPVSFLQNKGVHPTSTQIFEMKKNEKGLHEAQTPPPSSTPRTRPAPHATRTSGPPPNP